MTVVRYQFTHIPIKHFTNSNILKRLILFIDGDLNQAFSSAESSETNKTKKRSERMTGSREIDEILRTILDYIYRDFIESWYKQLTNDKEFTEGSRKAIEKIIANVSKRLRDAPLLMTITTKMVDDVAAHAKTYHRALKTLDDQTKKAPTGSKFQSPFHRRNKSDTDVTSSRNWNLGSANIHKKVANSTFYSVQTNEKLLDPDKQLIELFFDNSDNAYKGESLSDEALEQHLISVMETILYFTLETEDFKCDAVRSFLSSLLASIVGKSVIKTISDPDFINFQIANIFVNDPPASEFLIAMIRQCRDLSELRAVRSMITREMDAKHREPKFAGELASLKYTQKIIDLRITSIQNQNVDSSGKRFFEREKFTSKLPLLSLDEILSKDLALSYYLDYLSILNLQKYVIFYCLVQNWKDTAVERLSDNHPEHERQKVLRHLRDNAFNFYTEYLLPSSSNYLSVDQGLIEVLHIKIKDTFLQPEASWFDSISKFIYEKLKNEHVFLQNFYESPAYKKLLLELEEIESEPSIDLSRSESKDSRSETTSDDFLLDDEIDMLDSNDETSWNTNVTRHQRSHSDTGILLTREPANIIEQRLTSRIINTAINSSGNFAVYAIQVKLIEKDTNGIEHEKSWHIYRRYSKFLELKKHLLRRFPHLQNAALPFPKKQTFHNTNRGLIERRMVILNEFLYVICHKAESDDSMHFVILEFLEPDQDDREIHGTKVIKHLVNPLKSGMRTIKKMPDSFIGGLSRMFLHKNIYKMSIGDVMDAHHSNSEFPVLISFLNFLDVVFDLDSRSQWLKKGIQGILAAPFISQSINRRILDIAQKYLLEPDRVESVLCGVLNNVWPNGVRQEPLQREDTTKLRTRMAAKVAVFSYLSGEIKYFLLQIQAISQTILLQMI